MHVQAPVSSRHGYCSANYDVMGLIVQTVSGQSYATYVQQHIFAPLLMHDSFASEQEARRDGLAQGHRWLFGVPTPFDRYNPSNVPAGYLVSSAEDMDHYASATSPKRRNANARKHETTNHTSGGESRDTMVPQQ